MRTLKTLAALAAFALVAAAVLGAGCRDEVAFRNQENLKLVTEGMHWHEAHRIMGEWQNCDTITGRRWLGEDGMANDIFIYRAPAGASGDFEIRVSLTDSLVLGVYRGD